MSAHESVVDRSEDRQTEAPDPSEANPQPKRPKLLRDYMSMVGFNGVSIGVSFLNTSAILALMGRDSYGEIISLTSLSLLLAIFGSEWTIQSLIRYGTEEFIRTEKFTRVFWNRLFLCACGVAVILMTSVFWSPSAELHLGMPRSGLAFVLFYLPIQVYWLHMRRSLSPPRRHKWLYPLLTLERLVILASVGVTYALGRLQVTDILTGYVLGAVTASVISTWLIRSSIGWPLVPDRETVGTLVRYSWPMIPSVWMSMLSTNALDYQFVRYYLDTAQLGVYSLGVQVAGLVQQLPLIAGILIGPRIVSIRLKEDHGALERMMHKRFLPAYWLWTVALLGGAVVVASVGPAYIPKDYRLIADLVWPLTVVSITVPLWYAVWTPILTAFEGTFTMMWASVAAGLVNVVANIVLIPRYGIVGSAWASVLCYAATPLCAELITRRYGPREIPERGLLMYLPVLISASLALWFGIE